MTQRKHDISAQDFRGPLLRVLGKMTQLQSRSTVPFSDVLGEVLKDMDLREDSYGSLSSGPLRVPRWVSKAFTLLKRDGYGFSPRKGHWGLTPQGVELARETDFTEDAAVETLESDDPYLLSLAASKVPCLGYYKSSSQVCARCHLQGHCKKQRGILLSLIAEEVGQD